MNIFQKVTLKNLKENRTRTLVTIIGIILSAAMFSATTISISSLQHYLIQSTIYEKGNWYGAGYGLSAENLETISSDKQVKKAISMELIGFSALKDYNNDYKPYLCVYGIQQDFTTMMPIHLTQGRMPENKNEILLPDHLFTNGGINYQLDSTLELNLGNRVDKEGTLLSNQIEYQNEVEDKNNYNKSAKNSNTKDNITEDPDSFQEYLVPTEKRSYKVVGFYERPSFEAYHAPAYTALTIGDNNTNHLYDLYIRTTSGINCTLMIDNLFSKTEADTWTTNYDLLRFYGYSGESRYNQVLYGLGIILISIIMFGSISLIYNAFSISVSERTKQFGLLASIGATKRQLTKSVLFEALFLSCIGIPFGILSGLLGIGITFYFIKDMMTNILGITGDSGYALARFASILGPTDKVSLTLHPSFGALTIAICVSLLTILISAYIPAKRAMKKSAIDAIRQTDDIAIRPSKVKTSKLTEKLFGFEGMIATKNFKRNRKKYRATVISLFLSIVLFISASSWCTYLTKSVNSVITDYEYDIIYNKYSDHNYSTDTLFSQLSQVKGVTAASYSSELRLNGSVNTASTSKDYRDYQKMLLEQKGDSYQEFEKTLTTFHIVFLEDNNFLSYLKEQNLSEAVFYNKENPTAVMVDSLWYYNNIEERYYMPSLLDNKEHAAPVLYLPRLEEGYYFDSIGIYSETGEFYCNFWKNNSNKEIEIPIEESCLTLPISIGAVTSQAPDFFPNEYDSVRLFYPYSFIDSFFSTLEPDTTYSNVPEAPYKDNIAVRLFFQCENYTEVFATMVKRLTEQGISTESLYNYAANAEGDRAIVTVVNVFAFGFIILISLIAAANVFHTISTNIKLRRREFAMLKSIGMTPKGFTKIMNFECLLYGFKGLLYGLPVSFLVTWFIYHTISAGLEIKFFIPWYSIVIAVGSVFLVVFSTMLYSMRKIKKENTIDALKNENL